MGQAGHACNVRLRWNIPDGSPTPTRGVCWGTGTEHAGFSLACRPLPDPPAGTGTFGRVQLVRQKTAKRFFALKVMSIPDVIRLKQEQHVHNEKSVLEEVSHPFLVKL